MSQVVGRRGGNQNIVGDSLTFLVLKGSWFLISWFQKCVMFSNEIRYILPHFHSMFFDRCEIHIQAFVDFV